MDDVVKLIRENNKYHMISVICWNFFKKLNKQNRHKLIDTKNKLKVARWDGGLERWVKKVKGIKKYKFSGIKAVKGSKVQQRGYTQ